MCSPTRQSSAETLLVLGQSQSDSKAPVPRRLSCRDAGAPNGPLGDYNPLDRHQFLSIVGAPDNRTSGQLQDKIRESYGPLEPLLRPSHHLSRADARARSLDSSQALMLAFGSAQAWSGALSKHSRLNAGANITTRLEVSPTAAR
jgi:hypothetical protein